MSFLGLADAVNKTPSSSATSPASGKGSAAAVQEPPLEIHHHKLLDFLVSRRKLDASLNWKRAVRAADAVARPIFDALPADHPLRLDTDIHEPLTYFHCKRLQEHLANSGGDDAATSLMGAYTSDRQQALTKAMELFRKGKAHLADGATALVTAVNYDVPNARKAADRADKALADVGRKEGEYTRNAAGFRAKFQKECARYGIAGGRDIHAELVGLLDGLPALLDEFAGAVQQCAAVGMALRLYGEFTLYTREMDGDCGDDVDAAVEALGLCPSLQVLFTRGNVALTEFAATGLLEEGAAAADDAITVESNDAISIGGGGGGGDDGELVIELVDDGSEAIQLVVDGEDAAMGIEVECEGDGGGSSAVDGGAGVGPAKASKASMLMSIDARALVVDDLLELQSFLRERVAELQRKDQSIVGLGARRLAKLRTVQTHDEAQITKLDDAITALLKRLDDSQLQLLIDLQTSKRFGQRLAKSIKHNLTLANTAEQAIGGLDGKRDELRATAEAQRAKGKKLVAYVQWLKGEMEQVLSPEFDGRRVELIGEITNVA